MGGPCVSAVGAPLLCWDSPDPSPTGIPAPQVDACCWRLELVGVGGQLGAGLAWVGGKRGAV